MATVNKVVDAHMDASTGMFAGQISGLLAAVELPLMSACMITPAGVAVSDGTSFVGFNPRRARAGEPVTPYGINARFRYGTGLTPGAKLFVAADGTLSDSAGVGGEGPVALVIDTTDIVVTRIF